MSRLHFFIRVLRCFRTERSRIAVLLVLIGLSTLMGLATVWPMAILVDTVLVPDPPPSPLLRILPSGFEDDRPSQVIALALLVFMLGILQELLTGWRGMLNMRIGHAGMLRVRGELFRKLQELNLLFHRSQPQGDTIFRLTRDTTGCQQVLNIIIEVVVAAVTLAFILAVMWGRSVELTLAALAVVPLLLATNVIFGRVLRTHSRSARSAESDFTSTVQRAISTISLTQAFGRQHDEQRRFSDRCEKSLTAWYDLHWKFTCYRICVGLILGAGAAFIFGRGGWMAWHDQIQGHNPDGMTIGSLVIFMTYLGMLYDPLCKLSGAGTNMLEGVTAMERVFEVLDRETIVADSADALSLPLMPRRLALRNVNFAYNPSKPVLRNVSLDILPGQMIAFVGGSGVGKSTILHLLCRFFDSPSGTLSIDDHDFRHVQLKDLRRHIAVVFQDSLILPTTIAENIAYGRPTATLQEIQQAAEMAGAAEFIGALPNGYFTEIAEGGQNLSGGQKQRIGIARALLTEAPIIVLDEPTSSLDPHCEQLVVETLRGLKGRRTIIVVSHRLSTVTDCDCIFVMHEGRIIGSGSHEQLMAQRGWYFETARHHLPLASKPGSAEMLSREPGLGIVQSAAN